MIDMVDQDVCNQGQKRLLHSMHELHCHYIIICHDEINMQTTLQHLNWLKHK